MVVEHDPKKMRQEYLRHLVDARIDGFVSVFYRDIVELHSIVSDETQNEQSRLQAGRALARICVIGRDQFHFENDDLNAVFTRSKLRFEEDKQREEDNGTQNRT